MLTEEDLTILRALHDVAEQSALELSQRINLGVPVLVARLQALASRGYTASSGPTQGASGDAGVGYIRTYKGTAAVAPQP